MVCFGLRRLCLQMAGTASSVLMAALQTPVAATQQPVSQVGCRSTLPVCCVSVSCVSVSCVCVGVLCVVCL